MIFSRRILLGSVAALAVVGGAYFTYARVGASATPTAAPQPVQVAKGNLRLTVTATGTLKPVRASDLSFRSSGVVEEVYVKIGDSVKKGQPLAKLETRSLELQVVQAQINLRSAEISLETLIVGARPEDIASANASLVSARQRLETMQAQGKPEDVAVAAANLLTTQARLDQLLNPTATDIQSGEQAVRNADASLLAARVKLEQLKNPTAADISLARAAVAVAESNLLIAKVKLEELKSPPADAINSAEAAVRSADSTLFSATATLDKLRVGLTDENRRLLVEAYRRMYDARDKLAYDRFINAPPAVIDQDEQALYRAMAQIELAEKQITFPEAGTTAQQLRAAEAALENARSSLETARLKLDRLLKPTVSDSAAAESAVTNADASLLNAKTKLADLLNPKPSDIATARVSVTAAEASYQKALETLEILRNPRPADRAAAEASLIQTKNQLDKARIPYTEVDLISQKAAVEQALAQLDKVVNPGTSQDIARAQLNVDKAKLDLDQARYNLEQAVLTAPFDGVISNVPITAGSSQGVGSSTVVVSIVDPSEMQVQTSVDETDVAKVETGQTVVVTVEAAGQQPYRGRVLAIAPNATVQSGVATYVVTLSVPQPKGLRAGMTAVANIVYQEQQNVLLAPNRAIKTVGRERTVQLLVDGKPETRTIKVGVSDDQRTEVLEGLQEGDQVLVEGARTPATANQGANFRAPAGFGGGGFIPPGGR